MIKTYKCVWCGYVFNQEIERVTGNIDKTNKQSKGKKGSLSTQVKCPKCNNFIKTW